MYNVCTSRTPPIPARHHTASATSLVSSRSRNHVEAPPPGTRVRAPPLKRCGRPIVRGRLPLTTRTYHLSRIASQSPPPPWEPSRWNPQSTHGTARGSRRSLRPTQHVCGAEQLAALRGGWVRPTLFPLDALSLKAPIRQREPGVRRTRVPACRVRVLSSGRRRIVILECVFFNASLFFRNTTQAPHHADRQRRAELPRRPRPSSRRSRKAARLGVAVPSCTLAEPLCSSVDIVQ